MGMSNAHPLDSQFLLNSNYIYQQLCSITPNPFMGMFIFFKHIKYHQDQCPVYYVCIIYMHFKIILTNVQCLPQLLIFFIIIWIEIWPVPIMWVFFDFLECHIGWQWFNNKCERISNILRTIIKTFLIARCKLKMKF